MKRIQKKPAGCATGAPAALVQASAKACGPACGGMLQRSALAQARGPSLSMPVQAKVEISRPGDAYEREADAVADQVASGLRPAQISRLGSRPTVRREEKREASNGPPKREDGGVVVQRKCDSCGPDAGTPEPIVSGGDGSGKVQRLAGGEEAGGRSGGNSAVADEALAREALVERTVLSPFGGQPLPGPVKARLEEMLGMDFSDVVLHRGSEAEAAAEAIQARAFTFRNHVWLGRGESPDDLKLISHEVTHVVQQTGGMAKPGFRPGETVAVRGRTSEAKVQRTLVGDLLENAAWGLLNTFAPQLVPIIRQGPVEWLKERLGEAVSAVYELLFAPVRMVLTALSAISPHFALLLTWIHEAIAGLGRGDCTGLVEAANKIQALIEGLTAPVIEKLRLMAERVRGFFTDLWGRTGAPVMDFLRGVGGAIWERIQKLGTWLWEKTAPVRERLDRAWTWLKNRLGVGEGEEGQNGVLQWLQRKAGEAWEWIKARIEPIKRPLMIVGGILLMFTPAGPIIAWGAVVVGLLYGMRWIRDNLSTPDGVVRNRAELRGTILPRIMGAVDTAINFIRNVSRSIAAGLQNIMSRMGETVGAVSRSILRLILRLVEWLAERFGDLVEWVAVGLQRLADKAGAAMARLMVVLRPVFDFLGEVASAIGNVLLIPIMVLGRIWNAIPACIRNPFVNFLMTHMLSRIPLLNQIAGTPEIWARTQERVMRVVRQIFIDGDITGALLGIFRFLLDILNVPVDLVATIYRKAVGSFNAILDNPMGFLINILRAIKQGFTQFFRNILRHLATGILRWLTSGLRDTGIEVPTEFSFRSVLTLVLQILDITMERIFQRLERRIGAERTQAFRRAVAFLSGAWEWVSTLINEGPGGVWRMLQERMSGLWNMVLEQVTAFLMQRVVLQGSLWLLGLLDPTGIMAVVSSLVIFYRSLQTFIEYMRPILEIVNSVLDGIGGIIAGLIGPGADLMERLLVMALPIVIGFLANLAGQSGLPRRVREMLTLVRGYVDRGIDWVIDRAIQLGQGFLNMVGRGVAAVRNWWAIRKPVTTRNGERHSIEFTGSGTSAGLIIRSFPQPYTTYLAGLQATYHLTAEQIGPAMEKAREIEREKLQVVPDAEKEAQVIRINELATQLADLTQALPLPPSASNTPPVYGPLRHGFGTLVRVTYLQSPHDPGSAPSVQNTPEFDDINMRKNGNGSYYVKGHLLNNNLGGPGDTWNNLTPISRDANAQHVEEFESLVKDAVNGPSGTPTVPSGSARNFVVRAVYGQEDKSAIIREVEGENEEVEGLRPGTDRRDLAKVLRAERFVPIALECDAETITVHNGVPGPVAHHPFTVENNISYGVLSEYSLNPSPRRRYVLAENIDFSKPTATEATVSLRELNQMTPALAESIYHAFRVPPGRITNFTRQTGTPKSVLEDANPDKIIVGGNGPGA